MSKIKRSKVKKEIWVSVILGVDMKKISEYSFPSLDMGFWLHFVHSNYNLNKNFLSRSDTRGWGAFFSSQKSYF